MKGGRIELAETLSSHVPEESMTADLNIGEQYASVCHTALQHALEHGDAAENWLLRISSVFNTFHDIAAFTLTAGKFI